MRNVFGLLIISSLLLSACSSTTKSPEDFFKGQTEVQIFQDGEKALNKHNYEDAISHFETLNARYPFSQYSEQSQLDLIYAYYQKEDYPSTLAASDQFIRLYPRSSAIDYAYYMRGVTLLEEHKGFFEQYFTIDTATRDLDDLKRALSDFNQLIRYVPRSPYAADARQKMIYIFNALARHELQVAQFYYNHQSYVAAANRAGEVVRHYQGSIYVQEALSIMIRSYQKLGLTAEANDALRVWRLNYPSQPEPQEKYNS